MEIKLPRYLYKYRDWNDKFHKRILTHNEIYFPSARKFNDPFDSTIPMRYDLLTDEETREIFRKKIVQDNPSFSAELIEDRVNYWFSRQEWLKPENEEKFQEIKYGTFGILSVSNVTNNILMWSHYADSHKGFCVGFDTKAFDKFIKQQAEDFGIVIDPIKVIYTKEYPKLIPSDFKDDVEYGEVQFKYKSKLWSYEKEYRYVHIGIADISFGLDSGIIKKVILGCKMLKENKQEIKDILVKSNNNITLYQAQKKKDEFGLDIVEIDY